MSQIISVIRLIPLKWITGCDYLSPKVLLKILQYTRYCLLPINWLGSSSGWLISRSLRNRCFTKKSVQQLLNSLLLFSYRAQCSSSGSSLLVRFLSWSQDDESFSCLWRSNRKPFEFLNSWNPEFLNSLTADLNHKLRSAFSITVYDISLKLTAGRADINECILKLHLVRRKPNRHCSSTSRILVHYQRLSFLWYQLSSPSNSGDHSIAQNIWPNNLTGPF